MIFEKIALSKEMYREAKEAGMTLSELLEKEARKKKKFVADSKLTAFQQQLAARGLALSGAHAALIEDFYKTEESAILFPEVINQFVRTGMLEELKSFVNLKELTATRTGIDGDVYKSALVDLESDAKAARVGEKGEFPVVKIYFKDRVITLYKVGYRIEATYEVVRRMKVNVFGVTMKVLGRNITREKVNIAVDVLVNGDGNGNPITSINAETSGTLTYADIVNLFEDFQYFDPNLMISPKAMRVAYLNLTEYKDKNGPSMPDPPKKCTSVPESKIIALDTSASLEEIYENGGSLVEYDKIIEKQIQKAVVSEVSGWSKIFTEASKMLNVTFT